MNTSPLYEKHTKPARGYIPERAEGIVRGKQKKPDKDNIYHKMREHKKFPDGSRTEKHGEDETLYPKINIPAGIRGNGRGSEPVKVHI